MNHTQSMLLMLVGPPKSGLSVLFTSLRITGIKPIGGSENAEQLSAESIDRLLFQELDMSPSMVGGLPENWINTQAAEKTRDRIRNLLTPYALTSATGMIAGSTLCRTLPIWIEVCEELNIEPRVIVMIRHPWEVAQSLAAIKDIELVDGHLLWLSYIRDAMRGFQNRSRAVVVSFDQLLSDPVTTLAHIGEELFLSWPINPWSVTTELLNHVQPGLKHHHAANLAEKDKQIYRSYERLYQKIRFEHNIYLLRDSSVNTEPSKYNILQCDRQSVCNEPDLIDRLLARIGQFEKQSESVKNQQQRITVLSDVDLFAQFVFPSSFNSGETVETIPLIADEWGKISLTVPEPALLKNKPFILKPLNTNGMVLISAVRMIKQSTGEIFWDADNNSGFEKITVEGSAASLKDDSCLRLIILGNSATLVFPAMADIGEFPVEISLWIKASKDQRIVSEFLPKHRVIDKQYTVGTLHHLSCTGGTVISKCLAAMPNVVLLSEIHPVNPGIIHFNPFDPLQQFQKNYPKLAYSQLEDLKKIFHERILWILNKCRENNQFLIIRDHSHWDFLVNGCVDTPPLYSFLSELSTVRPILTLRNPVDSYLSLKSNSNFPTDVKNFDSYCHRALTFLEKYQFAEVFLYEDFVNNPDQVLKKMCEIYGIEYDPAYRNNFHKIKLTGDSGRGKSFKEIEKLDRRSHDELFRKEVLESPSFKLLVKKYDYWIEKYENPSRLTDHKNANENLYEANITSVSLSESLVERLFDKVIVISLEQSTDRRAYIQKHLSAFGIQQFEFFNATSGSESIVTQAYAKGEVLTFPPCFRCGKLDCGNPDCNNFLNSQQVATFITYRRLWQSLANGKAGRILVLEDDVQFHDHLMLVLKFVEGEIIDGRIPFQEEKPCLIRLGWALCDDHAGSDGCHINTDIKMANPCHALTREYARVLLSRFASICHTVDEYQHRLAPRPGEAFTVYPPIASELSWSTGALPSTIHPKPVRSEYLRSLNRLEEANANDRQIVNYTKKKYYRPLLIVGHPRCGTGYAAGLCRQLGIDVGHEKLGTDGISSWMFAVEADVNPYALDEVAKTRRALAWRHLVMPVRNIADAAGSVIREFIHAPKAYHFLKTHIQQELGIDLDMFANPLERAVWSITSWTRIILRMKPDIWFRIEDGHMTFQTFLSDKGLVDSQNLDKVLNTDPVNVDKLYKGVRYSKPEIKTEDWKKLSAQTWNEILWYGNEFEYKFPFSYLESEMS